MYKAWLQPCLVPVWYWSSEGVKRNWADTLSSKEWFDLDLWTCDLKINRDHLLMGRNPCTKFGIDQVKGSKDIEQTTQWAEKSGLTLTFEHVTWKSIGIIYSLRATPVPSWVLIMWSFLVQLYWVKNTWSTDRHTDRQLQNNMPPFHPSEPVNMKMKELEYFNHNKFFFRGDGGVQTQFVPAVWTINT